MGRSRHIGHYGHYFEFKKKKLCGVFFAFGLGFLCGLPIMSHAQWDPAESIPGVVEVRNLMTRASLPGVLNDGVQGGVSGISDAAAIKAFYEGRQHMPVWTGDPARINALVALLKNSWSQGLNPANYHVEEAESILSSVMLPAQRARLELILTDAVLRYGRDMTGMRVNPAAIGQRAEYWRIPMEAAEILHLISTAKDPLVAVAGIGPQSKLYKALQAELVSLTRQQAMQKEDPRKLGFKGLFKPGQTHKDIPALRAQLGVLHDPAQGGETVYDDTLAAAVMRFQKDHHLKPDGVIGPKTVALLNRSTADRIRQVVANMERIRWMEPRQPQRYIIVNIPSQMLWAVEDGKVAVEMPVVVGMPTRPTMSFSTEIVGVRFNPDWTVPMGIKMKDMLPKLQEDPYALSARGIEIMQGHGRDAVTVDPGAIDWNNVSRSEMNRFRMVQPPGENNALGQIRVLMPNDYDIYLHDTNHRELFVKEERLLSSGCVRLSEPRKIARFVLSGKEGWSDAKMEGLLKKGRKADIPVGEKIPVYIVYQTMWFDGEGRLVYGPDVYGQDKKLAGVLAARKAFDLERGIQSAQNDAGPQPDDAPGKQAAALPARAGGVADGTTLLASAQ